MQKFLTVTATTGRKEIIPIMNFTTSQAASSTVIDLFCHNVGALDVIRVTLSSADPLYSTNNSFVKGSMVDVLQNMIIEAFARGSWSNPYLDITSRIPITILSVLPQSS